MHTKTSQALYSYWNAVRGGRIAPNRFDIQPAEISELLPETFLLERVNSQEFLFRLAGTRICDQFGTELRGTNFLEGFSDDDLNTLEQDFATITTQGAVANFSIEAFGRSGRAARFEVVVMPLTHTRGMMNRCLGAISAIALQDNAGEEALYRRSLLERKLLWPDGKPQTFKNCIDRQTPFLPHIRKARIVRQDRRQFRVYDGGLSSKSEVDTK